MKKLMYVFLGLSLAFTACDNEDDTPPEMTDDDVVIEPVELQSEINEFVWGAMNEWYLWQDEVNNLADDRFSDDDAFFMYLNGFNTPEDVFRDVLSSKDRFSVIRQDYDDLFNVFAGVATTTGIEFSLTRPPEGGSAVIGVVRYVINGSDAEAKGVQRGDIFYAINGTPLFAETDAQGFITNSNLDLLNPQTFTMNFATIENDMLTPNDINIELNKTELTENPVHIVTTLDIAGTKVGYLMYNSFTSDFDDELNEAFGQLVTENIDELVLDLRYNGGGSVQSAIRLASMITGQFTGQLFSRSKFNQKWNQLLGGEDDFVSSIGNTPINSLNLSKVYIIATDDSASASELVINSLEPYIDVVHVGDVTLGKNEFSVTLVDNDGQRVELTDGSTIPFPYIFLGDETLDGADNSHKYALQPLVGTNVNADGFGEFTNGLQPDIAAIETLGNLGVLGDSEEPLLAAALQDITGVATAKSLLLEVPDNMKIKTIHSSSRMKPLWGISNLDTFSNK